MSTPPSRGARIDALVALGELLLPGGEGLGRQVRLAAEAPARFLAKVRWPDMDPTDEALPWLALIDGLAKRRRVAVVDWKADPEEVMASIDATSRGLTKDPARWAFTAALDLDVLGSTAEFLDLAGRHLARATLRLVALDDESDAYHLVLLDAPTATAAAALAKRAGYGGAFTILRGVARPASPPKAKAPAPRKRPRTRDEMYPLTYLEYIGGSSRKFWSVRVFPKSLFVTWGRLGTEGQWQSKEYQQRGEASAAADKLIAEKLAKGYVRAAGRPPREE